MSDLPPEIPAVPIRNLSIASIHSSIHLARRRATQLCFMLVSSLCAVATREATAALFFPPHDDAAATDALAEMLLPAPPPPPDGTLAAFDDEGKVRAGVDRRTPMHTLRIGLEGRSLSRRPPLSLPRIVARTEGYTYAANFWDLSIVHRQFMSPTPNLVLRFAFASLFGVAAAWWHRPPTPGKAE